MKEDNFQKESNNIPVKLPSDFHMTKYGIDVRLVNEDDSAFILSLRTDPKLSKYLHYTDNNEEKQRQWIREYKKRESAGNDYYLIYSKDNQPFGLSRIYNIQATKCTGGSWICKPGSDVELTISSALLSRDIMFDIFSFKEDNFEVRKGNLKVKKFHLMMECEKIGETEEDFLFRATPETHNKGKKKILKLLNIKE